MSVVGVFVLLAIASAAWVGFDASQREWPTDATFRSGTAWFVAVLVMWIVFLPLYLRERRRSTRVDPFAATDSYAEPLPRLAKTCPDCAEDVQPAARVCKHCGYRFDAAPATP